jgi:hypothetical protein
MFTTIANCHGCLLERNLFPRNPTFKEVAGEMVIAISRILAPTLFGQIYVALLTWK